MKDTLRAFIAIEFNDVFRRELVRIQNELRKAVADAEPRELSSRGEVPPVPTRVGTGCGIKWVEPDNIHLTLKFLGDVPSSGLPEIKAAMAQTAQNFPPFSMEVTELGAFPDASHPRIIWAGVGQGAQTLSGIASSLETNLEKLPVAKDNRTFSAHITLGRVRSPKGKDRLFEILKTTAIPSGLLQTIDRLTLFQSHLTAQGPVYSVLAEMPLSS
jgi:2'-5' RNA ligase